MSRGDVFRNVPRIAAALILKADCTANMLSLRPGTATPSNAKTYFLVRHVRYINVGPRVPYVDACWLGFCYTLASLQMDCTSRVLYMAPASTDSAHIMHNVRQRCYCLEPHRMAD